MNTSFKSYILTVLGLLIFCFSFAPAWAGEKDSDYLIRSDKTVTKKFELRCSDENVSKAYEMAIETVECPASTIISLQRQLFLPFSYKTSSIG